VLGTATALVWRKFAIGINLVLEAL
jgi:hypothetical protein